MAEEETSPQKIQELQQQLQELKQKFEPQQTQQPKPQSQPSEKKQPKIKIYTTPTCPYCRMAKDYFRQKNLVYEEFDVSKNEHALNEMVHISGQMSVPVIVIGKYVILGFDAQTIERILNEKNDNIGYA